jgi:transposase
MAMDRNVNRIQIKAYSITELANIYDVDIRTLKKWMKPFKNDIGEKQGRFFNIPQVKVILARLSLPSWVIID